MKDDDELDLSGLQKSIEDMDYINHLETTAAKLNQRIKSLENENAKLKCLALHLFREWAYYRAPWESSWNEQRLTRIYEKSKEAYRKAKKALKEFE